jgi:tripartite-type tricarboxylate transporter receptor subunit TctC
MKQPSRTTLRRTLLTGACAGVAGLVVAPRAGYADAGFPNKPLRLLVPFTPGGVSDGSARLVAEYLTRRLNQTVIVDNRPGASGLVSGQHVAQADPDGYTLMLGYNGLLAINPHVIAKMPYDTMQDLAAVGKVGDYPSVLAANPGLGVRNWRELFALSKSRAEGLSYGTSGTGGTEHLIGVLLTQRTGANLIHIPYKGAGPALLDAIAGHIPLSLTSVAGGGSHIRAGKLTAIAVSSEKRSPSLPDVPTFIESGVPDFVVNSWIGIIAPGRTPRPIIDKLNAELNAVLENAELRERLAALGVNATPGTPEAFHAEIKSDLASYGPIVKAAGIRPE